MPLRGYQVTNAKGQLRFLSMNPGWYKSRTAHIHCRVRIAGFSSPATNFTTQFFFPDALNNQIYLLSPYNPKTARDMYNATDNVFTSTDCITGAEDGTETTFNITTSSRYASANYNVNLDVPSTSTCTGGGTPPAGGPPPSSWRGCTVATPTAK